MPMRYTIKFKNHTSGIPDYNTYSKYEREGRNHCKTCIYLKDDWCSLQCAHIVECEYHNCEPKQK